MEFRRFGKRQTCRPTNDGGYSMIVTAISLVIGALVLAIAFKATLGGSGSTSPNVNNAPGVGMANNLLAKQTLSDAALTVENQAALAGGYGGLTAAVLTAAEPATMWTNGATTSPYTVSVATSSSGSITLATWSSSKVCWLIWKGSGGITWYGAQTGLTSCIAPALGATPTQTAVSSSTIGWQTGQFPDAP